MLAHRRSTLLVALLFATALVGAGCNPRPLQLVIHTPTHGIFTTAATVNLSGVVSYQNLGDVSLTVNGVPTSFNTGGLFSATITLDPSIVFNPIHVVATTPQQVVAERVVVVSGESVADGDFSLNSIALRLNDSGLDQVEPVITSLVDLDLATLLPAGTLVIDNFCYLDSFLGCIGRVDVTVSGSPPPSIGSFSIDIDSQTNFAEGDVTLNNLFIRANVDDATGVSLHCEIDINAAVTTVVGDYTLEPDAVDPSSIDVDQLGSVALTFGGFTDSTDCSGLLGGLVEALIGLFIGDIQDLVEPAIEDFLNAPDVNGNTPIAGAIETALADIEISGPIGQSLGVVLETPLFDVAEDVNGITLGSDGRVLADFGAGPGQCIPPAGAPDLLASYHVPEPFPSFGPNTPGGNLPYGLGICISSSAFNQLLKANVECGLLVTDLTELDLFGTGTPQPITAGFLALLIPEFGNADPSIPLRLEVRPTLAPVLTGNTGPQGELTEMRIGGLKIAVVTTDGSDQTLVSAGVDFVAGLDFSFNNATGELVPALGAVAAADVTVGIINDLIGANPATVEALLQALLPLLLPEVADVLGSFPLPAFLGLQLQSVEVGANGEFISIFTDLVPTP